MTRGQLKYKSFEEAIQDNTKWNGECLEWTRPLTKDGYGSFSFKGKVQSAHRIAYEIKHGKILDGLHICHKCGNKKCVNTEHLYAGTPHDNMRDKIKHGTNVCGEAHYRAKLTKSDILRIRVEYANNSITRERLASKNGVSKSTIDRIINKTSWKHVGGLCG